MNTLKERPEQKFVSNEIISEKDVSSISELPDALRSYIKDLAPYIDQTKKMHVFQYADGEVDVIHATMPVNQESAELEHKVYFIDVIGDQVMGYTIVAVASEGFPYIGNTVTLSDNLVRSGLATRRLLAAGKYYTDRGESLRSGMGFEHESARSIWERLVRDDIAVPTSRKGAHEFKFKETV